MIPRIGVTGEVLFVRVCINVFLRSNPSPFPAGQRVSELLAPSGVNTVMLIHALKSRENSVWL
jgi:hypothetical protein